MSFMSLKRSVRLLSEVVDGLNKLTPYDLFRHGGKVILVRHFASGWEQPNLKDVRIVT